MKTENEKSEVEIIIMRCYNYRATSGKRYLTTSIIRSHKLDRTVLFRVKSHVFARAFESRA